MRWILFLFLIAFGIFSILSAPDMTEGSTDLKISPYGDPLFIEVWEHQDGKVITGKAYKMMIDFPTYSLENGSLTSAMPLEIDPAAIAILGTGSSLSGDMGGGAASGLVTIADLPKFIGSYLGMNISIARIEGENVTLDLSGRQMMLEAGESWKKERTETQEIRDSVMKVTTTLTVWNHGKVAFEPARDIRDGGAMI